MPDYLSRVHHDDTYQGEYEPEVGCEFFAINEEETELTMATIVREQLKDGELAQVMKYLEEGELPIDGEEALHVMNLSDHTALLPPGVLYRCANKTNKKQKYTRLRKRIMVPASLVTKVLKLLHNDVLVGGHIGVTALTTKITDKFNWCNLHADILDYVKRCRKCALRKRAPLYKALVQEVTRLVACKQTFTTGRMPKRNARVARMHKTLENLVSVYISDNHKTWPDLVPIALWTIRSTTSFRTGYSPFTLLYGEDPVSMGMHERGEIPESLNDCEFYIKTKDNIGMFRYLAADAVKIYEKEMRNKLDDKARPTKFYEGDLVYMYDPLGSENKQSKFSNRYTDPYRVVSVKGDHLLRLKYLKTGKEIPHLVNIQKVKRAYGPWNPSIPSRIADKKTLSQKEVLHDEPNYLSHTTRDRNRIRKLTLFFPRGTKASPGPTEGPRKVLQRHHVFQHAIQNPHVVTARVGGGGGIRRLVIHYSSRGLAGEGNRRRPCGPRQRPGLSL